MDYKQMTSKQLVKAVVAYDVKRKQLEKEAEGLKDMQKEIFNELRARNVKVETASNGSIEWKEGYTQTRLDQNIVKMYLTSEQQKACEKITQVAGRYSVTAKEGAR